MTKLKLKKDLCDGWHCEYPDKVINQVAKELKQNPNDMKAVLHQEECRTCRYREDCQ